MKALMSLLLLSAPAFAGQDYRCMLAAGCNVTMENSNGDWVETHLNFGDIVNTDWADINGYDGWWRRTKWGWVRPQMYWSPPVMAPFMGPPMPSPWLGAIGLGVMPPQTFMLPPVTTSTGGGTPARKPSAKPRAPRLPSLTFTWPEY